MVTTKSLSAMFIALIIMAFTISSYAQDSKDKYTPEEKAKKMTDKMKSSLNLTDEQYPKMYNLNLDQIKWRKDNKAGNLSGDEKKKKREEFKANRKNILTAEQISKFKENKKENKKKHKKKNHKSGIK